MTRRTANNLRTTLLVICALALLLFGRQGTEAVHSFAHSFEINTAAQDDLYAQQREKREAAPNGRRVKGASK